MKGCLRLAALVLCALVFLCRASAYEVYVAPLCQDPGSSASAIEEKLIFSLNRAFDRGGIRFVASGRDAGLPSSFLEAMRLCQKNSYEYLIYGYIKDDSGVLSAELRLISRDDRAQIASFLAADDSAHAERFTADLSAKIEDFFNGAMGWAEKKMMPERRLLALGFSAAWWTPIGAWGPGLRGICEGGLRVRYVPGPWLLDLWGREASVGLGLRLEYAAGMNGEAYEPAFLHCIRLSLPADLAVSLGRGFFLDAGIAPLVEFEILDQSRKYTGEYLGYGVGAGFSAFIGSGYQFSPLFSCGIECGFSCLFFAEPLLELSPGIFFSFAPGWESGAGGAGPAKESS